MSPGALGRASVVFPASAGGQRGELPRAALFVGQYGAHVK